MNRPVLMGGIMLGALAIGSAGALWAYDTMWKERSEGTAEAVPSGQTRTRWLLEWPKTPEEVVVSVDALLSDGSDRAWERLTHLYKGSDESTKRRIVERAAHLPNLKRALAYVAATIGDDITPVDQDPMIEEAAELLKDRWKDPADLDYGRRLMLMQTNEKRKWVLAKAMVTFAAEPRADSDFQPQKRRLSNKLIDLHSDVSNGFIRASIADSMRELGAHDVAMVLAQGPNVPIEELEVAKRERAAQAEAMERFGRGR